MSNIKAIIYDIDGTLVDSEFLHLDAWDESLRQYGLGLSDLPENFRATMPGKKPIVLASEIVSLLDLSISAEELLEQKSTLFLSSAREKLRPMPGAVESVKRFKVLGYQLGIGTSLDRQFLDFILDQLQLADLFDVIITGDQIKHGKPDPETYLTVCNQLRVPPRECVVFEDAQSGIEAAKAAGTWCIALKSAYPQNTEDADSVIESFTEVTEMTINSLGKD